MSFRDIMDERIERGFYGKLDSGESFLYCEGYNYLRQPLFINISSGEKFIATVEDQTSRLSRIPDVTAYIKNNRARLTKLSKFAKSLESQAVEPVSSQSSPKCEDRGDTLSRYTFNTEKHP